MFFDAKNLKIVQAKKKHAYAITVLTRRFFPYVNFSYQTIIERLSTPTVKYFVAEYEGHTVGFSDLEFMEQKMARENMGTVEKNQAKNPLKGRIAKILGLVVLPEFQGKGIGKKLLLKLLSLAKKKAGSAFILVAEDNDAQMLYYANGFERQGTLDRELGGKKILLLKRVFS